METLQPSLPPSVKPCPLVVCSRHSNNLPTPSAQNAEMAELLARHLVAHLDLANFQALSQVSRSLRHALNRVPPTSWRASVELTVQASRPFSPADRHPLLLAAGPGSAAAVMAQLADMRSRLQSGQHQVTQLLSEQGGVWAEFISISPSGALALIEDASRIYLYSVAAPEIWEYSGQLLHLLWSQQMPCTVDESKWYGQYCTTWAPDSSQIVLINKADAASKGAYALSLGPKAVLQLPASLAPQTHKMQAVFSPCSGRLALLKRFNDYKMDSLQLYCCSTWAVLAAWACSSRVTGQPAFSHDGSLLALPLGRELQVYSVTGELLHSIHAEPPVAPWQGLPSSRAAAGPDNSSGSLHDVSAHQAMQAICAQEPSTTEAPAQVSIAVWDVANRLAFLVFVYKSEDRELHMYNTEDWATPQTSLLLPPSEGTLAYYIFSGILQMKNMTVLHQRVLGIGCLSQEFRLLTSPFPCCNLALLSQASCLSPDSRFVAVADLSHSSAIELRVIDLITGVTLLSTLLQPTATDASGFGDFRVQWGLDCCSICVYSYKARRLSVHHDNSSWGIECFKVSF